MTLESLPIYFLAANSADGFVNGFKNAYDAMDGWRAYLIKGGPGTGKSSFMKKFAHHMVSLNIKTEIIPCSSDPDSLDGVILPDRKVIILDATAPHTLDPVYPGVCEEILNFGQFWNIETMKPKKEEILHLIGENKDLHLRASRLLSAIGQIMRNEMKISLIATDIDKTFDYGEKLAKRYLKNKGKKGKEWVRYLSGVTPKGLVFYKETIDKICEKKVLISDEYGTVSNILFSVIRDISLSYGYEIITVRNNFLPDEKIDHILIPELSLAFCTNNAFSDIDSENIRKIHAERFMHRDVIKANRSKILFGRRVIKELLINTVGTLKEAKEVHDRLEAYYIKAMDFGKLNSFFDDFVKKLTF